MDRISQKFGEGRLFMNIICLDTEFTGTVGRNEILELSIFNSSEGEIYHQLFKPENCRKWTFTEKIHGITPDMVADKPTFRERLPEMQKIFDEADLIVGFAIENDIRHLEKSGIKGLYEERCLDVRYLYWANRCDSDGVNLFSVPNLVKCATECGFDWENVKAHSASADALATLHCFRELIKEFIEKNSMTVSGKGISDEQIIDAVAMLNKMVEKAVYDHEKESAYGYVYLFKQGQFYSMVIRHTAIEEEYLKRKAARGLILVAMCQVNDRWHAQYDIQKKFQRKWVRGAKNASCWKLNEKDVNFLKKYTNEFRGDSKLYKHMLENSNIW